VDTPQCSVQRWKARVENANRRVDRRSDCLCRLGLSGAAYLQRTEWMYFKKNKHQDLPVEWHQGELDSSWHLCLEQLQRTSSLLVRPWEDSTHDGNTVGHTRAHTHEAAWTKRSLDSLTHAPLTLSVDWINHKASRSLGDFNSYWIAWCITLCVLPSMLARCLPQFTLVCSCPPYTIFTSGNRGLETSCAA
jgi:hypothetical protein